MGYYVKKTEHAGPKRGVGAYWGRKRDAKEASKRARRANWKREIRAALREGGWTGARLTTMKE